MKEMQGFSFKTTESYQKKGCATVVEIFVDSMNDWKALDVTSESIFDRNNYIVNLTYLILFVLTLRGVRGQRCNYTRSLKKGSIFEKN